MRCLLVIALVLSSIAACAPAEKPVDDEEQHDETPFDDFDRACVVDDDCVAVYFGDLCNGVCRCENTGIAVSDYDAWKAFIAGVDCGDSPASDCDCRSDGGPASCIGQQCEHVVTR